MIAKSMAPGTEKEKDQLIQKRIKKFFKYHVDVEDGYFHPRIQPDYRDPETKPLPCSIILYGVDFLSTKRIKKKFQKYNP